MQKKGKKAIKRKIERDNKGKKRKQTSMEKKGNRQ